MNANQKALKHPRSRRSWQSLGRAAALSAALLSLGVACDDDSDDTSDASVSADAGTGGRDGASDAKSSNIDTATSSLDASTSGPADAAVQGDATARDGAVDAGSNDAPASADANTDAANASKSPGEIAATFFEANAGEVSQGQVALGKAPSAAVRAYAQDMVTVHSAANATLLERVGTNMIALAPDAPLPTELRTKGQATLNQLVAAPAATFNQLYMQSQVAVHTEVLQKITSVLEPSAAGTPLAAYVAEQRVTVTAHLQTAQAILASLGVDAGATTDGP